MFCPPSPYLSKNNRPRLTSPPVTAPTDSVAQPSISLKVRAMHVSALSRWTKTGVHKQRFCPIRHITWSKPKPRQAISLEATEWPSPHKTAASMSLSTSSPAPSPCVLQKSMPPRMPAPKLGRRLRALNSPASRNQLPAGLAPLRPTKTDGRSSMTFLWAPLPSMNRKHPRAT